MSKLYKNYVLLKIQNSEKMYLFKSGLFYIFLDSDAEIMSKILNLKLTNLNSYIKKCGFPVNSGEKYFRILKNTEYNIEVIESTNCNSISLNNYISEKKYSSIISEFLKINIDELSIPEAFDCLHNLHKKFTQIKTDSNS